MKNIPDMLPGEVVCVFGKRGSGKTTAAMQISVMQRQFASKVAWSPLPDILDPDSILCRDGWKVVKGRLDGMVAGRKRIYSMDGSPRDLRFAAVVNRVQSLPKPVLFLIDEVDQLCSPHYVHPALQNLIEYGRHTGMGLICCARRPAQVHRSLTANCDYILTFAITEPGDRKALENYGIPDAKIPLDKSQHLCYLHSYK